MHVLLFKREPETERQRAKRKSSVRFSKVYCQVSFTDAIQADLDVPATEPGAHIAWLCSSTATHPPCVAVGRNSIEKAFTRQKEKKKPARDT